MTSSLSRRCPSDKDTKPIFYPSGGYILGGSGDSPLQEAWNVSDESPGFKAPVGGLMISTIQGACA